jgi:ubiquinone biosynthesis protein
MVEVLLDWADDVPTSTERLVSEVGMFVDKYHGVALKQLRLGVILSEMAALIRDNQLVLPADLTMLFKALITLEGMGRQIDPEFDIVSQMGPFLIKATIERNRPEALLARAQRNLTGLMSVANAFPQDLRRFMRRLRTGTVKVSVDMSDLARFGFIVDRAANRLTVGMVTASLIIGSAIVMTVSGGPKLLGLPALGVFGFIVAGAGALWLVLSIWKTPSRAEERDRAD